MPVCSSAHCALCCLANRPVSTKVQVSGERPFNRLYDIGECCRKKAIPQCHHSPVTAAALVTACSADTLDHCTQTTAHQQRHTTHPRSGIHCDVKVRERKLQDSHVHVPSVHVQQP